jgi:hypothetical protein
VATFWRMVVKISTVKKLEFSHQQITQIIMGIPGKNFIHQSMLHKGISLFLTCVNGVFTIAVSSHFQANL